MAKDQWGRETGPKPGFIVRSGGRILKYAIVALTIPLILVFLYLNDNISQYESLVITRITEILTPEGSSDYTIGAVGRAVDNFFTETTLGGIVINPLWGSIILAFIFGMIFSLALKTNQPMPVWIIAFIVVIIVMVAGMGSWAIPVTLVYISEAVMSGEFIVPAVLIFWVMAVSAFIIGFGAQWYIAKGAQTVATTVRMGKQPKRKKAGVKIKFSKRGKK